MKTGEDCRFLWVFWSVFVICWGSARGLLGLLGSLRLESGVWRSLEPGGLGGGGGWRSGRDEED